MKQFLGAFAAPRDVYKEKFSSFCSTTNNKSLASVRHTLGMKENTLGNFPRVLVPSNKGEIHKRLGRIRIMEEET